MPRKSFDELWALAVERKGADYLAGRMPEVYSAEQLAGTTDDRWLAAMAQTVFSAGFAWRVIKAKWDGFEEAFEHFEPRYVAAYDDGRMEDLRADKRIVRNPQKIKATVANAAWVNEIAREHGSFGAWAGGWPDEDVTGLWAALAKGGSRLGGNTGPRTLRIMGRDTFILTPDVAYSLTEQGIIEGKPTTKKSLKGAQEAFNAWRAESGRPMAHISLVVACTVDRPDD